MALAVAFGRFLARNAEEAMRKLESNCSLVIPQTVPQLTYQGAESGTKFENESARKTLPLEAVRGNLAERGDLNPRFRARLVLQGKLPPSPFLPRVIKLAV
jgi:hypothetical protein